MSLCLLALAAMVLFQLVLARYWLDLIDEGYFADLADRVARGELPYRDFATPYTPALHYLHAWAFGLLGRDLVTLRLLLTAVKAGLAVVLYVLGRRLVPPAFAALPVLLLFAIDTAPLMWEPHPAWYSLLFGLLTVWSVTRLIEGGSDRWTALAGVFAALAFAFKQNIGLFVLAATMGFLLFESPGLPASWARLKLPRALTNRPLWLLARGSFALLLVGALAWLLRPYLEPRVATVFLLPMATLAVGGLVSVAQRRESPAQFEAAAGRIGWLLASFVVATLPWLVPLLAAVGPAGLPLGQFIGAFDLSGFYWELAEPRLAFFLFLLAAIVCPIAVRRFSLKTPFHRRLVEAAVFSLVVEVAIDLALVDTALATPDLSEEDSGFWNLSVLAASSLLLYLPSLSFWGAMGAVASPGLYLSPTSLLNLRWYLLAGSLVLFNLYPRMDAMHVTFSGPLLFVVGAYALYCLFGALERRLPETPGRPLYRILLFASLLVLPVAAATPNLDWRVKSVISRHTNGLRLDVPDYVPMEVAGANVLVPANSRDAIGSVAHYIQDRTARGEPIFVYPTLPMFYFLADRPNPTRFGHVYPAAATHEEQLEMIQTLEDRRVRYVIWDQYWVNEWGLDGKHLLNKPLTDYLLASYRVETMIGPFHILARSE